MKAITISRYCAEFKGFSYVDIDEPPPPGNNEVTIEILASPIHPADLLSLAGDYAVPPPLPMIPGGEAIGRIIAVGNNVSTVSPGMYAIPLPRGNWVERRTLAATDVIVVPHGDCLQLAMLKVVPATAWLMLTSIVSLASGSGVIQNAANSSVGLAANRLADHFGVTMINVVRREELIDQLKNYGARNVFLDGPDLAQRVRLAFADLPISLGLDAVAGQASFRLSACLSEGGTMVNYGLLSGEPVMVAPQRTIFEDIHVTGFWLSKFIANSNHSDLENLYEQLAKFVADGTIETPIEACYPLEQATKAVRHAAAFKRDGKIMFTPSAAALI
jgi:trans-2-enoyl-CoA reductase